MTDWAAKEAARLIEELGISETCDPEDEAAIEEELARELRLIVKQRTKKLKVKAMKDAAKFCDMMGCYECTVGLENLAAVTP